MINKKELDKFLNAFDDKDLRGIKKIIDQKLKISEQGIEKLIQKEITKLNNNQYINYFLQVNAFKNKTKIYGCNSIDFLNSYSSKEYNDDVYNIIKNNVEEFIKSFNKNDLLNYEKKSRFKSVGENYKTLNRFINFGWNGGEYAYMWYNIIDLQFYDEPIKAFGEKTYNRLLERDEKYFLETVGYLKDLNNLNYFEMELSYLDKSKTIGFYFDQELNKVIDLNKFKEKNIDDSLTSKEFDYASLHDMN